MTGAAGPPGFLERGEGRIPIVFLHGIGGGAEAWEPQLSHFAATRRALAWWMPGYGPSPALPALTFAALAEALESLLDEARVARAHLVGHSIGGMVAQTFAATRPHRLASLILSATSPAFGSRDGAFQQAFMEKRLKPLDDGVPMAELARVVVAELVGEAPDPEGVRRAVDSMARVPPDSYRAALRMIVTFDGRASLPQIAVPALVLAGEHDTNAPAAMMERMAGKIAGARFAVCDGAGHLANLERPQAFNRTVETFIADVETEAAHDES